VILLSSKGEIIMNQEKTGKFISKLRKEKKLTQADLAEKMGVSINAVSKWERGLSFPDVSLYKSLCDELGISIEELINGEKGNSEEAKEKAIFKTIDENNKTKKKSKNIIIILCIIILIFIVIGLLYYNLKLKVDLDTHSDYLYKVAIDYLKEEEIAYNPDSKNKDFNVFYAYHGFGIEKNGNYRNVYMWIFSDSYYLDEDNGLESSSGFSMPYKFVFRDGKVIRVEVPKDGNEYVESIKKMFPGIIAIEVLNFHTDKNINKLMNEVLEKKNSYYSYLNLDMSKIKLEDISYHDVLFSVSVGNMDCIPVELSVLKNNRYILYTAYKECPKGELCNAMLSYTKSKSGTYDYDVIEIIRHSKDANLMQFTNDNLPKYNIYGGNGYHFITDDDNKHLTDFLKSIKVDLNKCAKPDYIKNLQ
jgi:transcriptional regulator with XRE-family HTH domain